MYAIVGLGGKQYRVEENTTLLVNRLVGGEGDAIAIENVLAIGGDEPRFGAPNVPDAAVGGVIVEHLRGPKINGLTYKAKKNVRRHYGHRQELTKVKIESIKVGK